MFDKKLKIRIHIQQPKTTEAIDPDEQGTFEDLSRPPHWRALEKPPFDRRKIAIAVIVFVVFVVIVGYMLIGDNETSDSGSFGDDHQALVPLPEKQPESSEEQVQETAQQADNHDATDSHSTQHQEVRTADTDAPVPRIKPLRRVSEKAPISPKPATKPVDSGLEERLEFMPPPMASNAAGVPVAAGAKKSAADHSGVIRAQLTHQIRQREPVDNVDRVLLERNGSSSIYFFIELSGFGNQQLSVDWYFEDYPVTETKLHIGARKWRTHAKKLLSKGDAGDWRVILRDQAGQVLAERRFVVEI